MPHKTLYYVTLLALMVLPTVSISASSGSRQATRSNAIQHVQSVVIEPPAPSIPSLLAPSTTHQSFSSERSPAGQSTASLEPAASKLPQAPVQQTLITLKPGSDMSRFAGYLAWLRFNKQIKDFQRVEGTDVFLVTGAEGLGMIATQPEVAALGPDTPAKLAAVRDATQYTAMKAVQTKATSAIRSPVAIQAYTPTTPTVNVNLYEGVVWGQAISGTVYVTVTKAAGGSQYTGSLVVGCDFCSYGIWLNMPYPYIEPGDTIQVYEDGVSGSITIVIPDLRPTIDRDADIVSGKAPVPIASTDEGSPPALYVSSGNLLNRNSGNWEGSGHYVITDGAGNYSVVFTYTFPATGTGTYDIRFTTDIYVVYFDANQNSVGLHQQTPGVGVQLNTDYASGYTKPQTPYTVTLRNSAGVVKGMFSNVAGTVGYFGGSFRDVYGNAVKSAPGDAVTLEGAYGISVPVVNVTAFSDPAVDKVTGQSPSVDSTSAITLPNLFVRTDGYNGFGTIGQSKSITSNGHYDTGVFTGTGYTLDIRPGDTGQTTFYNSNADKVILNFVAPVLAARGDYYNVYQGDNYVSGYAPCISCTVSIALKRSGSTVGTALALSRSNGWFSAWLSDIYGNATNILAGDTLEASAAGSLFASLSVPTFTVTSQPSPVNQVVGTTDATVITTTAGLTQTLAIWPADTYDYRYGEYVQPTGSAFTATNPFYYNANPNYGSNTLNWSGGQQGHYRYINADGYPVYGQFRAPYNYTTELNVRYVSYWGFPSALADAYISGRTAEPYSFVSIALERSGSTVGSATTTSDGNGYYVAQLHDALNAPVPIQDGDVVEVTSGTTTSTTVVPMTANANYDTDIITGTTTGNLTDTLQVGWYDSSWGWQTINVTTTEETYSATLANLQPWQSTGYLRYTRVPGVNIYKRWTAVSNPPAPPQPGAGPQVMLRGDPWCNCYRSDNYVFVNSSASGILTVFRAGVQLTTWNFWSGGASTYLYTQDGGPAYLQAGDVVKATGSATIVINPTATITPVPTPIPNPLQAGDVVKATSGTTSSAMTIISAYPAATYTPAPTLTPPPNSTPVPTTNGTTVITVPVVSITSQPNPINRLVGTTNADVITTTYSATRTLAIWPTSTNDYWYGKYVLLTGGAFTATTPFYYNANPNGSWTTLNWIPGTQGHYRYTDAAGNVVYGMFIAPIPPKASIQENDNLVTGYVATPGAPVTVTLKNGATVKATAYTTSDRFNSYFYLYLYDTTGNRAYILAGDKIEVSSSPVIVVPVVPLAGLVNATTNVVSGSGPANASLSIEVNGNPLPATTDVTGAFSADFTGIYDIQPGNYVRIRYINADGNEVYLGNVPAPYLYANKGNYSAGGAVAAINAPVTVTLKHDTTVKATAVVASGMGGWFSVSLYTPSGAPAIISTGDTVEATSGGTTMSLPIPTLTAVVNPTTDSVTGQAPAAGSQLRVELYNNNGYGVQKTVTADASGNYAATNPFDGNVYDVMAGWHARITYVNADGNQVDLSAIAPVIYVHGDGGGYTNENRVSGYYAMPNTQVSVTVRRGGSTVASTLAWTNWSGWFSINLNDTSGIPLDILGGDQVMVSGSAMTVTVPTIFATAYAVTDTLQGTISPAGSRLKVVDVWHTGCVESVTSDGTTGAFSTANPFYDANGNPCAVNFNTGDAVDTHYVDATGNWVYQRFIAVGDSATGAAQIYARWNGSNVGSNFVSGLATIPNASVSLALKRGGVTVGFATTTSDGGRWFSIALLNVIGKSVPILTGDTVEMSSGGTTTSFVVPELTAAYNTTSNVVYGHGPANGILYCSSFFGSGNITIGPDGKYVLGVVSYPGYVRYTDSNGNSVYTSFSSPYAWVGENSSRVSGYVSTFYGPVTVTLKTGTTIKASARTTSDAGGWFTVYLLDAVGNPAVILAGDTVEVSAPSTFFSVPVVPLSLNANLATDVISGIGPAGASLNVYVSASSGSAQRYPTTDASGNYTADFSGYYDIKAGDQVEVSYWNNSTRSGVYLFYNTPLVRVNATANTVDGYATPNHTVSLALKRVGSTIATASVKSNADGYFSAFFIDTTGAVVDIQAGDVIDVTASPTNSITVPALTASLNAATNVVSGSGPASSAIYIRLYHWNIGQWYGGQWYGGQFNSYDQSVTTDSSGNYAVDFTGQLDLLDYDYAYVRYTDVNGNQSAVNTLAAGSPWKTQAEEDVINNGATLKVSTFGSSNGGAISVPMFYTHSGGTAVFASRIGSLYITAPDGAIYDMGMWFFAISNATPGKWKVQVRIGGGEGNQYAMAAGTAHHTYYVMLPIVMHTN